MPLDGEPAAQRRDRRLSGRGATTSRPPNLIQATPTYLAKSPEGNRPCYLNCPYFYYRQVTDQLFRYTRSLNSDWLTPLTCSVAKANCGASTSRKRSSHRGTAGRLAAPCLTQPGIECKLLHSSGVEARAGDRTRETDCAGHPDHTVSMPIPRPRVAPPRGSADVGLELLALDLLQLRVQHQRGDFFRVE